MAPKTAQRVGGEIDAMTCGKWAEALVEVLKKLSVILGIDLPESEDEP